MTDRTEEQERVDVDELLEFLNEPCTCGESPYEPCLFCNGVRDLRDHLTRLCEQKAELKRAARAARREVDYVHSELWDDANGRAEADSDALADKLLSAKKRLAAALDESEGRGGTSDGDLCDRCGHPLHEHGYSGCGRCECDHDALPDLPGPDLQPSDSLETDSNTYVCPKCGSAVPNHACDETAAHTPDPSEGEVRCDHENTVLDDNVEWCPDCRRVMPEDPEDAEDDGRGEGAERYREALKRIANWESDGISWRYDFARVVDIAANALRDDE